MSALCGAWGGCDLPRGHNRGKVDIPSMHHVPHKSMSNWRGQAVEAGVRAILDAMDDHEVSGDEEFTTIVVDAVEPIIRDDERQRIFEERGGSGFLHDRIMERLEEVSDAARDDERKRLREQVGSLRYAALKAFHEKPHNAHMGTRAAAYADVLALLNESL